MSILFCKKSSGCTKDKNKNNRAYKAQMFIFDAMLSLGILFVLIIFIFPMVQKEYLQTDFTYSSLSRICRTHLFSGITSSTLGNIALMNSPQKEQETQKYLNALPDYVGASLTLQNKSDTYNFNNSIENKNKIRVVASALVFGVDWPNYYLGKATLTCWQKT